MGRSFENRKHSMAKTAGQKSKLYAKYGTKLYVTARNGVADPESNPALRNLIEKAKREQVPSHVIEKAIEKAAGVGGQDFVAARYEGFGPGGCSVIVDCLTDNNNRTITEVRNCFNRANAKLGAAGSVAHMFDHLTVLSFAGDNDEQVLEAMLDADINVDDVECSDGKITLFAPADEFYKAKTALLDAFPDIQLDVQEVSFLPQTTTEIAEEHRAMFEKFLMLLEECDDVQDVYHSGVLPG